MTNVIFGNHSAVRVQRAARERIRRFYIEVLGGTLTREFDDKDDFRLGGNFYIAFLYAKGSAETADKGATYGAGDVLSDDDFLKAIFLELKADDVDLVRA